MIHDKPKDSIDNDLFKRAGFSLRIASLIKNRIAKESIVIGINGPWGEGKTTVLNFVAGELKSDFPKTIVVRFNPWMFSDEEKLLKTFFATISKSLSASLDSAERKQGMSKHEINEDLKGIANIISEYSESLLDVIPGSSWFGGSVKKIIQKFTSTALEDRKNKLSALMCKYERKIVILIDDIDRLSKDEVYSIFRLVKLTADFDYFIYLLAYDSDRVAEAIGDRFGNDIEAGNHFLEKIVQVPINLPEILHEDLAKLFFKLLSEILTQNKIEVRQHELKRFEDVFNSCLQFKIDSPRKAIRYANAIQFSLPLMNGEINVIDLILLEGLKVFFNENYEFIKANYLLLTFGFGVEDSRDLKDKLEKNYINIEEKLSDKEKESAKGILMELFPTLRSVWKNTVYPSEFYKRMTFDKRIASKEYFNRYFTFSLADGEISDNAFTHLTQKIKSAKLEEVPSLLTEFTFIENIGQLIQKLRIVENEFTSEESILLAKGLSMIGGNFHKEVGLFGFALSSFSQAAILISRLLANIPEIKTRVQLTFDLVETASSFEFAIEILKWIGSPKNQNILLEPKDFNMAWERLKKRCLNESVDRPFYVKFPDEGSTIIANWERSDKEGLVSYVKNHITDVNGVTELLLSIVGKSYSSSFEGSLISDLNEGDYKWIDDSIGSEWLYDILHASLGNFFSQDVRIDTKFSNSQSEENLIKQFMYWHQKATGIQWEIDKMKQELSVENIANIRLSPEISIEIVKANVIPLLSKMENHALEFLEFFNDYDRDIKATVGKDETPIASKTSDWNKIEETLRDKIRDSNKSIHLLDYTLLFRGFKKSLVNQYMRVDIKFQFNEYSYSIMLSSNHETQKTFPYDKQLSAQELEDFAKIAVAFLSDQMRSSVKLGKKK